jgi:hypothetical protein
MMSTITHTKPYAVPTRGGGEAELQGPGGPEGARDTIMCTSLSFTVVSLFVDIKINPFRPSPSHFAAESLSLKLCAWKFSTGPPLLEGTKNFLPRP